MMYDSSSKTTFVRSRNSPFCVGRFLVSSCREVNKTPNTRFKLNPGIYFFNFIVVTLSKTPIDPTGKYVLTTRCRTGRSVRGTRLPPCTTFEERRELERVIVKGLMGLTGDLKGDYYPLHGSQSYAAKPNGMSEEKEESLRKNGNLFQEPDSTLLLSSGCGRHWPDARGEMLFEWLF